jgi:transcriptional regulator with XRE-family HTH domain
MKKIIGSNVRYLRKLCDLTQTDLAGQCGIFRTYLSRIESGRANPSLTVIVALAAALEVLPYELLQPDIYMDNDPLASALNAGLAEHHAGAAFPD